MEMKSIVTERSSTSGGEAVLGTPAALWAWGGARLSRVARWLAITSEGISDEYRLSLPRT